MTRADMKAGRRKQGLAPLQAALSQTLSHMLYAVRNGLEQNLQLTGLFQCKLRSLSCFWKQSADMWKHECSLKSDQHCAGAFANTRGTALHLQQ